MACVVAEGDAAPAARAAGDSPAAVPAEVSELNERYPGAPRRIVARGARTARFRRASCRRSSSEPAGDRRFNASAWHEQPFYSLLRQSYLLYAGYLRELARLAPLPPAEKRRLEFATRQYVDAMAPTNFPGNQSRRADARRGNGRREPGAGPAQPRRRRAEGPHHDDRRARVRRRRQHRGDAGQRGLSQRADRAHPVRRRPRRRCASGRWSSCRRASTSTTSSTSRPANSFVAHAVAQGHTVFMVSWRNVPPELGTLTWDDYLEKGALTALRVAREITRQQDRQRARLLRRRHDPRLRARRARGAQASRSSRARRSSPRCSTSPIPGDIGVYVSRAAPGGARAAAHGGAARARQRARQRVREPARRTSSCGTTSSATT